MYRVLLVDDEPMSLVSLKHAFNWSRYGFQVAFQTTSPLEAFQKVCSGEFDVVFTDIRMPKMSGLDLIRKISEVGVKTTFIIVSGFGEFNYAKKALHEGVFDYCLKPVSSEDADELLSRLSVYLNSKKDSYDIKNYDLLLNGLLDIDEFMVLKNFKPRFKHYQVVYLLVEESNSGFDSSILFFNNINNIHLKLSKRKYIYILNFENSITANLYNQYAIGNYASLFSLGLSHITKNICDIPDLIKEADISTNKYFITGINNFYEYTKSDLIYIKDFIKDLVASIDYMRVNALRDSLDNATEYFISNDLCLEDAVYLWNQLVSHLLNKYGIDDLPKNFEFMNFSEILARFKTLSRLCDYLEEAIFSTINISKGPPEGAYINDSIKELIDYVNQNYCSDISMKQLSNMFHINYTYCCELFKKVMGVTFSDYITGLRMKKAVNLLDNSNLSIEKVAMETGFCDYYYFNNVFKKHYNITPSKYRKAVETKGLK